MPLSEKAAANILRLLNTEAERNGILAFRLLNSQQATEDFLLSLCGHFMVAGGEERLLLRNCLRTLLRITVKERGCSASQKDDLMWLLNYEAGQGNAQLERFLSILEYVLGLDILVLSRYLFSRGGQGAPMLLQRGAATDRAALLESRVYNGPYGRTLDLSRLNLAVVPEETNLFRNLEALNLSHNELSGADVFFLQGFRQLRFLSLAQNQMARIPDGLLLLPRLQEADLRMDGIELPLFKYLRHPLKDVLKVNLRMESGFTLDQFIDQDVACFLKNWAYEAGGRLVLDLSGQKAEAVPEAILRYPQLEYLDLRDTPIAFLPSWLLRMPRLREIYCDRGVEYNDAFLRKGLMVYRDEKRDPPRPGEEPPPWQANLSGFSAALPVAISVEGLKDKH